MFYCGIDIAKYKHEATVIDGAGAALLDSISFANSKEGCEKLLALFQLTSTARYALCTAGTFAVFCGIYALVYGLTARSYRRIVA